MRALRIAVKCAKIVIESVKAYCQERRNSWERVQQLVGENAATRGRESGNVWGKVTARVEERTPTQVKKECQHGRKKGEGKKGSHTHAHSHTNAHSLYSSSVPIQLEFGRNRRNFSDGTAATFPMELPQDFRRNCRHITDVTAGRFSTELPQDSR